MLTVEDVAGIESLLRKASRSTSTGVATGADGRVWTGFKSVYVPPDIKIEPLKRALALMNIALPGNIDLYVDTEDSVCLICRPSQGTIKYFGQEASQTPSATRAQRNVSSTAGIPEPIEAVPKTPGVGSAAWAQVNLTDMCTSASPRLPTGYVNGAYVRTIVSESQMGWARYWVYVATPTGTGYVLTPYMGNALRSEEVRSMAGFLSTSSEATIRTSARPELVGWYYFGGGRTAKVAAPTIVAAVKECVKGPMPERIYFRFQPETAQALVYFYDQLNIDSGSIKLHPKWEPLQTLQNMEEWQRVATGPSALDVAPPQPTEVGRAEGQAAASVSFEPEPVPASDEGMPVSGAVYSVSIYNRATGDIAVLDRTITQELDNLCAALDLTKAADRERFVRKCVELMGTETALRGVLIYGSSGRPAFRWPPKPISVDSELAVSLVNETGRQLSYTIDRTLSGRLVSGGKITYQLTPGEHSWSVLTYDDGEGAGAVGYVHDLRTPETWLFTRGGIGIVSERKPSTESPKTSSLTTRHQRVATEGRETTSSTDSMPVVTGLDFYYPGVGWQPKAGNVYQLKLIHHDEEQSRLTLEYEVARGASPQRALIAVVRPSRGEPQVAVGQGYERVEEKWVSVPIQKRTGMIVLSAETPRGTTVFLVRGLPAGDKRRLPSIVCLSNLIEF